MDDDDWKSQALATTIEPPAKRSRFATGNLDNVHGLRLMRKLQSEIVGNVDGGHFSSERESMPTSYM